jgi:hypothetical protein
MNDNKLKITQAQMKNQKYKYTNLTLSKLIISVLFLTCIILVSYFTIFKNGQNYDKQQFNPEATATFNDSFINVKYPKNWKVSEDIPTIVTDNKIYQFESNTDSTIKISSDQKNAKDVILLSKLTIKEKKSPNPLICEGCAVLNSEKIILNRDPLNLIIVDTDNDQKPDFISLASPNVKNGDKNINLNADVGQSGQIQFRALVVGKGSDDSYSLYYEFNDTNSLKQSQAYTALSQILNSIIIK